MRQLGRALVQHHDALRLQYRFDAGSVAQFCGEPYDPVEVRDLRDASNPVAELERHAAAAQADLDLARSLYTQLEQQLELLGRELASLLVPAAQGSETI